MTHEGNGTEEQKADDNRLQRQVGRNLVRIRLARGLSRATLGLRIGRSEKLVTAIEAGSFRLMISDLASLAHALDVPAHLLLENEEEETEGSGE